MLEFAATRVAALDISAAAVVCSVGVLEAVPVPDSSVVTVIVLAGAMAELAVNATLPKRVISAAPDI